MTKNRDSAADSAFRNQIQHMIMLEPVMSMTEPEWLEYAQHMIESQKACGDWMERLFRAAKGEAPANGTPEADLLDILTMTSDTLDQRIKVLVEKFGWDAHRTELRVTR